MNKFIEIILAKQSYYIYLRSVLFICVEGAYVKIYTIADMGNFKIFRKDPKEAQKTYEALKYFMNYGPDSNDKISFIIIEN